MARPRQDGLLYFSFDTDFFYADKRIKRLHSKYGNDGLMLYIYLLTEIYRNGYYISWDKESAEDTAADLYLKEGFMEQVMTYLRGRSLLIESKLSTGVTIITSPGIQKRYQEAKKGCKRQIEVNPEIWLLSKEETASFIKVTNNASNSEKNPSNSEKNPSNSEKNPIKENKGKENKGKQREMLHRFGDFISVYPKDCNCYLTEINYRDLIESGSETEDNLVSCAKNYADACKIQETPVKYIKNAENFLKDMTFEQYLPGKYKKPAQKKAKNSFNNFPQRDYDMGEIDELERKLLGGG